MSKILTSILTIVLITSQISLKALAEEVNAGSTVTNHVIAQTHEAASGFNIQSYNPSSEINNILNSLVNHQIDLTSILHDVSTGQMTHTLDINVGGQNTALNSNQLVTPAEAIALSQVLATGHQTLDLSALGNANGGSLNASALGNNLNNLVLPNNVTLIDNSQSLTLSGNLVNYGDIQFNGVSSLSANSIYNAPSGEIVGQNNLTINANQSLINEGTISSAYTLSINTPTLYNAGTIEALAGNLNIANSNSLDITSSALNANFEALTGSINISETSNSSANGVNVLNGNFLSRDLNFNVGENGYVQGFTGNVTGNINDLAGSVHLGTSSADMLLGNNNIFGDPTFVNNNGDITFTGSYSSSGANLAIIASGNINVNSSTSTSASITTGGGNLYMIAGLGNGNITLNPTTITTTTQLSSTQGNPIASGQTVSITLGGSTGYGGGNIDLVTSNTLSNHSNVIDTTSSGSAGNVTLLALEGSATGGYVLLSSSSGNSYGINADGSGTGNNGNVLIISTATGTNPGIEVGSITNAGGASGSGTISLYSAYPNATGSNGTSFDSTGSISGTPIAVNVSSPAYTTGSPIQIDGNITSGSNIIIGTNGAVNTASGITITDGGSSTSSYGALYITANSGVSFNSSTTALSTNASSLTINSGNGSIYVNDSASQTALMAQGSTPFVNNSTFSLTMTSTNGSISVANSISGTNTNTFDLTATGTGAITSATGALLTATTVNLFADSGHIGLSSPTFNIDATNLSVTASGGGSAYITDSETTNPIQVNASSLGLPSSSGLEFYLNTPSTSNENINIAGAILVAGSSSTIELQANGTGYITASNNSDVLTASTVTLTTDNGYIGTSSSSPIYINASFINASSVGFSAYLSDSAASTTIDTGSVNASGTFY